MSISDQIAWEKECLRRGTEQYYATQDRLREKGQGETTDVMSYVLHERLQDAAEALEEQVTGSTHRLNAVYDKIVRMCAGDEGDYIKITYIGLKAVLKAISVPEKNTLTKTCIDIAAKIEAELKCTMFEAKHPEYYDAVRKSLKEQNVQDYVHKHKVMMLKFNEFEIEWYNWSSAEKVQIGSRVVRALIGSLGDLIFIDKSNSFKAGVRKTVAFLNTTVQFDDWAAEFEKERGLLNPAFLPLKVPPRAWDSINNGGYYTPNLRMFFIKTRGKEHREFVEQNIPQHHIKAVNKMQRTSWCINKEVLRVQEEIYKRGLGIGMPSNQQITPPPFPKHLENVEKEDLTDSQKEEITVWKKIAKRSYGAEQQRKGQVLAFMQSHKLAKELVDWEKFHYVYTCDFRGRIYCATIGLSPQGADTAKGLIKFSKPVTLGKEGVKWLAIHGANTFGEDKLPYSERVKWIQEQEPFLRQVAEDPISHRDIWGNADKPYQFLAFCFDWAACDYGRDHNATSQIPVGLDGSCNGLQHFSAMLHDDVGAKATNLSICDKPQDIYQEVADVTTKKLKEIVANEDNPIARKWLQVGIDRKCAKRPVMTLPYGATQQSARTYIMEYTIDNWSKFNLDEEYVWEYARYLTPILWSAIGDVVVAAREGMSWLQKNVPKNEYTKWLTPLGFPVYQFYKAVPITRVATQLDGSITLAVRNMDKEGTPVKSKQRNSVSPNYVHSMDSTHMVMTINSTDLVSYAMIHDDFGTHAGNTDKLFKSIRTSFYNMYNDKNHLEDWAEQVGGDVSTLPTFGKYNINDIHSAEYFFG